MGDDGIGANYRRITDGHTGQDRDIPTDPYISTNVNWQSLMSRRADLAVVF